MGKISSREVAELLQKCRDAGCQISRGKSGHYRIKTPSGQFIFMSSTPGDHRAILNARSVLRRYGILK